MGWKSSYIEVTTEIDLNDYDDEVMEYVQPDNISDALDMLEVWGYTDGDILEHMMDDVDGTGLFISKLSNILTVETALQLVNEVYEFGHSIQVRNLQAKANQIAELHEKIRQLENPTTTEETTHES
jgi:hypothetical protein